MFILTKLSITSHYDDFLTVEIISFELFLKIWENKKKCDGKILGRERVWKNLSFQIQSIGPCIIASILIEETNPYFICSV